MFTGLVKDMGAVIRAHRAEGRVRLTIRASRIGKELKPGDSVSVNGVCLTVVTIAKKATKANKAKKGHKPNPMNSSLATRHSSFDFEVDVVPETLRLTSLGRGSSVGLVNLEPAMKAGQRLDGHVVQGHVDGTGRVKAFRRSRGDVRLTVSLPRPLMRYVAKKGSIALDGVSLTVAERTSSTLTVALVPYTLRHTTLGRLGRGDIVNIEVDVLARYAEVLMGGGKGGLGLKAFIRNPKSKTRNRI